jgi:hypothetical protein
VSTVHRAPTPLAVIANPPRAGDVAGRLGWTRYVPPRLADAVLPLVAPFPLATTSANAGERLARVDYYALTATADQLQSGRINLPAKLAACERLAERDGAGLLAFGGAVGPALRLKLQGERAAGRLTPVAGLPWTAGEDGEALLALWALRAVATLNGKALSASRVVVLNAAAPLGALLSHLAASECGELVLVDRFSTRLSRLTGELLDATGTAAVVRHSLPPTDRLLIVGGAAAADYLAEEDGALTDTVLLDPGRFADAGTVREAFTLQGGLARLPAGATAPLEYGYPERLVGGAIAEGILLALAGERPLRRDGRATATGCARLAGLARRFDLRLGGLLRSGRLLPWQAVETELSRRV